MSYIRPLDSLTLADIAFAGDKAARLGEMISAGLPALTGFGIGAPAYRSTLAENQIDKRIAARLSHIDIDDPEEVESAAEEIRRWIEQAIIPTDIASEISSSMAGMGAVGTFAIRASRVIEDVINPRASGLEQAFLAVAPGALRDNIRRCWATPWTSRAIYYRQVKKMPQDQVTIAVIVQPTVQASAAGVMFTANPLTGARDEIQIDAMWGLGEAIVSARWPMDHFVLDKITFSRRAGQIANKRVMQVAAPEGGIDTVAVPDDRQDIPCLNDEEMQQLATLGRRVEEHFGETQDIEWCKVGQDLVLLQARPLRFRG